MLTAWEIRTHRSSLKQLDRAKRFVAECVPVVRVLAAMNVRTLVSGKGKWANPAQANLIAALQPIWCRVTGRTAGLTAANLEGDKRCQYAEWLRELLTGHDLPVPPTGTVVDVVRSQNRKIRHPRMKKSDG